VNLRDFVVSSYLLIAVVCHCFGPQTASAASSGKSDVLDPISFRLLQSQLALQPLPRGATGAQSQKSASFAPIAAQRGEIAVVDTGAGVFQQAFPFDLADQTVRFSPAEDSAGYRIGLEPTIFRPELGPRVGLADDDSVRIALQFEFPFFGQDYQELWVNSDGNVTFNGPDFDTTERNAARVLTGGPRICPLFSDLDPTRVGASVRVLSAIDRLVVSWLSVPPYTPAGDGSPQTFQLAVFSSGVIEFSYPDVTLNTAVVGLGSGDRIGEARAVDFSSAPMDVFSSSVVEIFQEAVLDLAALSQGFYREFEDAYDFLVIFHDFELGFDSDAFAFYLPVRNSVLGIGFWPPPLESRNLVDIGDFLGSPRRLQGLMFMGLLDKYPDGPFERIDSQFGLGLSTPMTVLAHEAAHRFLARTLFIDREQNAFSTEMLGRQLGHWSYFYNSDASLLEGNRIVDHGPGEFRFETVSTIEGFSSMDLYLMGLIPSERVSDSFLVRDPDIADTLFSSAHEPLAGVFFNGERVDITIDDIVEAHGPRIPGARVAQQNFRYAFLLVHEAGQPPSAESLSKMEGFRGAFDEFFDEMTGGGADAATGLKRELAFSSWPAVGLVKGDAVDIAAFRPFRGSDSIAIDLTSDSAAIAIPEQVTIPAGSDFIRIPVEAREGGVARIEGSAGDEFEVARSAIRVHGSTAQLRAVRILPLEILFGDPRERLQTGDVGQPLPYRIFVQIVDENLLAIRNVAVHFEASGDGHVSEDNALSDGFGFVAVEWTLASKPGANQLRVSIPGSLQPDVVIDAVGSRSPARQRNLRRQVFGN
jgi:hypothetical protein